MKTQIPTFWRTLATKTVAVWMSADIKMMTIGSRRRHTHYRKTSHFAANSVKFGSELAMARWLRFPFCINFFDVSGMHERVTAMLWQELVLALGSLVCAFATMSVVRPLGDR